MASAKVSSTVVLPAEICQHIDLWLQKFPANQKQSVVIEALRVAQKHFDGWLSVPVMQAVAGYIGMPEIAVFEIASFYDMFETEKVGRHTMAFCTGLACMLRGVDQTLAYAKQQLGVNLGETTADGMITLKEVQCMGACDGAPMCQIDQEHYHLCLDQQQVDQLITALRSDQVPTPALKPE